MAMSSSKTSDPVGSPVRKGSTKPALRRMIGIGLVGRQIFFLRYRGDRRTPVLETLRRRSDSSISPAVGTRTTSDACIRPIAGCQEGLVAASGAGCRAWPASRTASQKRTRANIGWSAATTGYDARTSGRPVWKR
jgi:hypothetical protein